jgi:hypothetical protein
MQRAAIGSMSAGRAPIIGDQHTRPYHPSNPLAVILDNESGPHLTHFVVAHAIALGASPYVVYVPILPAWALRTSAMPDRAADFPTQGAHLQDLLTALTDQAGMPACFHCSPDAVVRRVMNTPASDHRTDP